MQHAVAALYATLSLTVMFAAPAASACGGVRTETRLPADGATDVPLNARIYLGGFGPGAFGPRSSGQVPYDGWKPVLSGPAGTVATTLEVQADGRAWWALASPTEPLLPNTVYTVVGGGAESHFTTGTTLDTTPPPPPMNVTVTPQGTDPCADDGTCGMNSILEVAAMPAPPGDSLYRVFVYAEGETSPTLVGLVPADATEWGVGLGDGANNVRAFAPGDVSGLTPVEVRDTFVGKTLCVSVKVEDLAGNAPWPAEVATACGVLPDSWPGSCPTSGDADPGDLPEGDVGNDVSGPADTDVSAASAATSSGCQSALRPWPGAWLLGLVGVWGIWRRRGLNT